MPALASAVPSLLEALLDALAPRSCAICDTPTRDGFCRACRAELPAPPCHAALDGIPVIAAAPYRSLVARAVRRFKFEDRPDLAPALASLLAPRLVELLGGEGAVLIPVPLHTARLAERRYDQAALLARAVARRASLRAAPRALVRVHPTLQQARLDRAARQVNVSGAFVARQPARIAGRRVVVVDDVITTGSTARECARALGRAGAEVIAIAAVCCVGDGPDC